LAGTLFQDTKLPLTLWFQMIWWFVGPKNGASALALMQNFGIGSYRTSWVLLNKLRSCTALPLREPLDGAVEVDEAFLGGENNKEIIAVAAEKRGKATGRIRLKHIKSRGGPEIQGFITEMVLPGSTIISDRHNSYPSITKQGYVHDPQKKPYFWEEVDGDDERLLPRAHRVISLMKRWYYGTYQGRVNKENLQPYLDEFVFRFNRRTSGSRGLLFHRMVESAVTAKPKPH
jgi:transposase-like protein